VACGVYFPSSVLSDFNFELSRRTCQKISPSHFRIPDRVVYTITPLHQTKLNIWGGFLVPVAFFKHDSFLGALTKLRKANITFRSCPSVRPSVHPSARPPARMDQLGSHLTDFHEIWYLSIFLKSVQKIRASLNSEANNGYFTWRRIYFFFKSLSILLIMRIFSDTSFRGHQNTHFRLNICCKSCRLWDNTQKYCIAAQSTRQHGACAIHAGYLRLHTYTQNK